MEWLQLIGICLLASMIVVIVKPMNPGIAGLLCTAFGVMLVGALLPNVWSFIEYIHRFLTDMGLEGEYYGILFKAMGIVLVTQLAEQICSDLGAQSIAERVEMCGRLAMLSMAVPLFIDLTRMTIGILR